MKVLDFGLAKAIDEPRSAGAGESTHSPTLTRRVTRSAGMILGTAAYMSAGAGAGQAGRQTQRHLGVRLCALRDADGHARLRRRRCQRHARRRFLSGSRTGARSRTTCRRAITRAACSAASQKDRKAADPGHLGRRAFLMIDDADRAQTRGCRRLAARRHVANLTALRGWCRPRSLRSADGVRAVGPPRPAVERPRRPPYGSHIYPPEDGVVLRPACPLRRACVACRPMGVALRSLARVAGRARAVVAARARCHDRAAAARHRRCGRRPVLVAGQPAPSRFYRRSGRDAQADSRVGRAGCQRPCARAEPSATARAGATSGWIRVLTE